MMRTVCFLFLLLGAISINAQDCANIVFAESFEDYPICNFEDGCAGNWCASHGRPDVHLGAVCDGTQSAEIAVRHICDSDACPIVPVGPFDPPALDPVDDCALGGGIFYTFDQALQPGNYRISFCYCGKPGFLGNGSNAADSYRMGINVSLINDLSCQTASQSTESFPFDNPYDPPSNPVPDRTLLYHHVFYPAHTDGDIREGACHFNEDVVVSNLTFSITEPHSQLWINGWAVSNCNANGDLCIDNIIIESIDVDLDCDVEKDLTACAEEGDFGFIAIKCAASFEWDLPAGSEALEFTSDDFSVITQAGEGTYTVTITDAEGCVDVRTYEITGQCCEEFPCTVDTPVNLGCEDKNGITTLTWDPIADAIGYIVTIIPNSPVNDCCPGPAGNPLIEEVETNSYQILDISYLCMAWNVTAICSDGELSEPSEFACFSALEKSCRKRSERRHGNSIGQNERPIKLGIFPNPARDQLSINLLSTSLDAQNGELEILDLMGNSVYAATFSINETVAVPTSQFPKGMYLVRVRMDNEEVLVKTVVIAVD